jgi:general secretion pathway protein K
VNGRRLGHRGVALITVMLISALAAMLASDMAWDNSLDVRRTMVLLQRDQAVQVALGAESWVRLILSQDAEETQTDTLGDVWAQELPPLPIDGGDVFGSVEDLQGRFNVNNLIDEQGRVDEPSLQQFQRLLAALELDPRIAGAVVDWLDPDQEPHMPEGAEDATYTAVLPPYRTADRMLTSISELAAVEGIDKAAFDALAPYLTALPVRTEINANTAPPAILRSLSDTLTDADVSALVEERGDTGFPDVQSAFGALLPPGATPPVDASRFFLLRVVVRLGTVRVTLYSVLQRDGSQVTPLLRSFGTV